MAPKKDKIRIGAEEYFIQNFNATYTEIAEIYPVSTKTLGEWAKKNDWESKRRDYHSSPVRIKQLLQEELLSVAQGNPPKLPADGIRKLMISLDECDRKLDPNVVHQLLKELDVFISKIDPAFAIQCLPFHKQFLQHRIAQEV